MTLEYKACKKELKRERERQSLLADNNDELKRQLDDMYSLEDENNQLKDKIDNITSRYDYDNNNTDTCTNNLYDKLEHQLRDLKAQLHQEKSRSSFYKDEYYKIKEGQL